MYPLELSPGPTIPPARLCRLWPTDDDDDDGDDDDLRWWWSNMVDHVR